jgi:hypothetical protein
MVLIAADNRETERCLETLVTLLTDCGAQFHESVVLKCDKGCLSIEAPPELVRTILIRIPEQHLLPLSAFRLSLANDDSITVSPADPGLSSENISLMETMIELYNLTAKVTVHRNSSLHALMAARPALMEYVRLGRLEGNNEVFREHLVSGDERSLMLNSFFATRVLDNSDDGSVLPVLLPAIDLVNHHHQGLPFLNERPKAPQTTTHDSFLSLVRSPPVAENENECFAYYGTYDAFDAFLSYGFINESVSFVRSIPRDIQIPGVGTIRVLTSGTPGRLEEGMPDSVRGLDFYMPEISDSEPGLMTVSSLLIPGPEAPRALRRVLNYLIGRLSPDRLDRHALVLLVEELIVESNRAYYKNLKRFLKGLKLQNDPRLAGIRDTFSRMCDVQLTRIEAYVSRCLAL